MPETRWIACNACGADDYVPLTAADGWTIGRCRACGLVYVNPVPFFEAAHDFSEMSRSFEYTEYMHQPISPAILAFEHDQLLANADMMARIAGTGVAPGRGTRFLDIGCGSGASVRAATDLGWEAVGIDIDPELIREGREQLQVDLRCVPVLEADLPMGAWDLVKLRDVVEHLPDPLDVLVRVRELLAPGGAALLVTPNERGVVTRTRAAVGRRRPVVATVPPPHHLHSFGPETLARTLRRAGLRPVSMFTTTPSDGRYVTSSNIARARARPALRPIWRAGRMLGMGSVLVCWARKA